MNLPSPELYPYTKYAETFEHRRQYGVGRTLWAAKTYVFATVGECVAELRIDVRVSTGAFSLFQSRFGNEFENCHRTRRIAEQNQFVFLSGKSPRMTLLRSLTEVPVVRIENIAVSSRCCPKKNKTNFFKEIKFRIFIFRYSRCNPVVYDDVIGKFRLFSINSENYPR